MEAAEQLAQSQSTKSQPARLDGLPRRPTGYWNNFNEWWRGFKEATGVRPLKHDIECFYSSTEAQAAWAHDERPSIKEVCQHCKGMRTKEEVRAYFREYRLRRSRTRSSTGSESSDVSASEDHTRSACTAADVHTGCGTDEVTSPDPERKRPRRHAPSAAGAGGGRPPRPPPKAATRRRSPRGRPSRQQTHQHPSELVRKDLLLPSYYFLGAQQALAARQPGGDSDAAGSGHDTSNSALATIAPAIQVNYEVGQRRGTLNVASNAHAADIIPGGGGDSAAASENAEQYSSLRLHGGAALDIAPLQLHDGAAAANMTYDCRETQLGSTTLAAGGPGNNGSAAGCLAQVFLAADDGIASAMSGQRCGAQTGEQHRRPVTDRQAQAQEPPCSPRAGNASGLDESCNSEEAASQSAGTQHSQQQSHQDEVAPRGCARCRSHSGRPQSGDVCAGAARQWDKEAPPVGADRSSCCHPLGEGPSWLHAARLPPAPPLPPLSVMYSQAGPCHGWPGLPLAWSWAGDAEHRPDIGEQHTCQAPYHSRPTMGGFASAPLGLSFPQLAAFAPPAPRNPPPAPKAPVACSRGDATAMSCGAWGGTSAASGPGSTGAMLGPCPCPIHTGAFPGHVYSAAWYPPPAYGSYMPAGGYAYDPYGCYPSSAVGLPYPPRFYPRTGEPQLAPAVFTACTADAAAARGAPLHGRISASGSPLDGGSDDVPAAPARGALTLRTAQPSRPAPPGSAAPAAAPTAGAVDLRWSPTSPSAGLTNNSVFCWAKASAAVAAGHTSEGPNGAPGAAPAAARALGGSLAAADGRAAPAALLVGGSNGAPASFKRGRAPGNTPTRPIAALVQARSAASGGRRMEGCGGAVARGQRLFETDDLGDLLNEAFNGGLWETKHQMGSARS
ncbi:hypothetical protein CHLRE_06g285350v5 [Chlamydomonas reinhardtii]|uniref:Uncharacterized protein n=1 Tax=Chlamydomonas reinhardtii TaxID=3055 RepID=A0A2K3DPX0_CHLRE|nr:uncharacterized protein CHLRE_06g285350v5 [Chlamydomonas reinhardtii]PNW82594.1 hypothetical protein CHLRE_06g285350v5 [Chlamydomonas reinhardtii]